MDCRKEDASYQHTTQYHGVPEEDIDSETKQNEAELRRLKKIEKLEKIKLEVEKTRQRVEQLKNEKQLDLEKEEKEAERRLSEKKKTLETLRNKIRENNEIAEYLKNLVDGPQLSEKDMSKLRNILTLYDEQLGLLRMLQGRAQDNLKYYRQNTKMCSLAGTVSGSLKIGHALIAPMSGRSARAVEGLAHGGAVFANYFEHSSEQMLSKHVTDIIQEANECLSYCKELKRKFDGIVFGKKAGTECLSPINGMVAKNDPEATLSPLLKTTSSEAFEKAVCFAKECVCKLHAKDSNTSENGHITRKKYFNRLDHVALIQAFGETLSAVERSDISHSETTVNYVCKQISHFVDELENERDYLQEKYGSLKPQ